MLVRFDDNKGKPQYINAVYVKAVIPKGPTQCLLEISGRTTKLKVSMPAETAAELVNAAMPNSLEAILAAEDQNHTDQVAAAAAAG